MRAAMPAFRKWSQLNGQQVWPKGNFYTFGACVSPLRGPIFVESEHDRIIVLEKRPLEAAAFAIDTEGFDERARDLKP